MSRIHDMGGRFGDVAVVPEAEEVKFHADWHPRAMALTVAAGTLGAWNIDVSRHARECLATQDYAAFSYYEKWIAALADLCVAQGLVTRAELEEGAGAPSELAHKVLQVSDVSGVLARGGPVERTPAVAPAFEVGARVRTAARPRNATVAGGHTRLPSYAAGAEGVILRHHGTHVFPDTNAHGLGEAPEPLYAVAFPASALWQAPEHPDDDVILDLWESYLRPVT